MSYYLTFGQDSVWKDWFVEIETDDPIDARAIIRDTFGQNWSLLYSENERVQSIDQYGLRRLCVFRLNKHDFWRAEAE